MCPAVSGFDDAMDLLRNCGVEGAGARAIFQLTSKELQRRVALAVVAVPAFGAFSEMLELARGGRRCLCDWRDCAFSFAERNCAVLFAILAGRGRRRSGFRVRRCTWLRALR
eukprot:5003271-Pyramimonas_sp.AAC.1